MQTKTVASPLEAKVSETAPVSRRSFLAGGTAAAATASTLVAGEILAAEPPASAQVTPALARLFNQWEVARREERRLSAIDDDASVLYHRTAPDVPDLIAAPLDEKGRPAFGYGRLHYARRSLEMGPGAGTYVLRPSYWLEFGDEERAKMAEAFVAADEAAEEAAGARRTNAALEAHWDLMYRIEAEIERFNVRSFEDLAILARWAQLLVDDRRQLPDGFSGLIVGHILRLASSSSGAGITGVTKSADDEMNAIRDIVQSARDAEDMAIAAEGTTKSAEAEGIAERRDADFVAMAERIWAEPVRSLQDVRKRAELAHRYSHQYFDDRDPDFVEGLPIGGRCDAELVKAALIVLRQPLLS